MGRLIEITRPGILRPTEKRVLPYRLGAIMLSHQKNPRKTILVAKEATDERGGIILLDGHHRACLADLYLEETGKSPIETHAWIPDHEKDYIEEIPEGFCEDLGYSNFNVGRLGVAEPDSMELEREMGIRNIKELRGRCSELESIKIFENFCKKVSARYAI